MLCAQNPGDLEAKDQPDFVHKAAYVDKKSICMASTMSGINPVSTPLPVLFI